MNIWISKYQRVPPMFVTESSAICSHLSIIHLVYMYMSCRKKVNLNIYFLSDIIHCEITVISIRYAVRHLFPAPLPPMDILGDNSIIKHYILYGFLKRTSWSSSISMLGSRVQFFLALLLSGLLEFSGMLNNGGTCISS